MNWKDKIAELLKQIEPKKARMNAIMKAAAEDGDRALDESEAQEFDELRDEVKELSVKLERFKALDDSATTAKPAGGRDPEEASRSRGGALPAEPKKPQEKGVGFARAVMLQTYAKLKGVNPIELAKSRYPNIRSDERNALESFFKSQVAGATTADPSWAGPLVYADNLTSEFVEYLRPMTIIGKFGQGGIPSLRAIPFNVRFPAQVTGGDGYWVGEGQPKPLTRFSFEEITLRWTKVANIAVVTEDLLRFSTPSAEIVVRNALAEALQARLDSDFINPSITLQADVRPASITNGATTSAASGVDAAAVRADIKTLISPFITANIATSGIVLIMRQAQALSLSLMRNDLGQREFPDITINGGFLEGMPVIASQYVPQGVVVAAAAPEIYLADDGGVSIDLSREASLEMADSSLSNAVTDGASPPVSVEATLVSMFQTNSVAIRAERFINWRRRRTAAVAYLTAVGWGNEDTSPPQAAI
jgi:HK97 family phage major capsid protein